MSELDTVLIILVGSLAVALVAQSFKVRHYHRQFDQAAWLSSRGYTAKWKRGGYDYPGWYMWKKGGESFSHLSAYKREKVIAEHEDLKIPKEVTEAVVGTVPNPTYEPGGFIDDE